MILKYIFILPPYRKIKLQGERHFVRVGIFPLFRFEFIYCVLLHHNRPYITVVHIAHVSVFVQSSCVFYFYFLFLPCYNLSGLSGLFHSKGIILFNTYRSYLYVREQYHKLFQSRITK